MKFLSRLALLFKIPFVWNLAPLGNPVRIDAIITHAAGPSFDPEGGSVNKHLAAIVEMWWANTGRKVPIIAQAELAAILERKGIPVFAKTKSQEECVLMGEKYIETYDVAKFHLDVCKANGWKRVLLVTHQGGHLPRAYWTTQKLGWFEEIVVPPILTGIYDPQNKQKRWRHPWTAWPYEMAVRMFYFLTGRF